jgi:hypothetical protein
VAITDTAIAEGDADCGRRNQDDEKEEQCGNRLVGDALQRPQRDDDESDGAEARYADR